MLPDSTTLLRCHPADQNTSFALFWLPVLSQFLTTRRLHSTPHSRTCCSRHHLWPCHLCPHQHPLCMGHTLLYVIPCREQSLPTKPSTLLWVWSVQIRALVALLAMKVKRKGKWIGREPEKNTSMLQYCSLPTAYRESSICHEPMQARTLWLMAASDGCHIRFLS